MNTHASQEIIRTENVTKKFGETVAVDHVNYSLNENELAGIIGSNGAGKTTLMKTIGGFLKPSTGSIMFANTKLIGLKSYNIAQMGLKYIPQDKKVFSDLTVRENLELGSYATQDYNWDKVIEYFPNLKLLLERKAGYLSGGERQMLMIGRAILGDPQVLLVDEPTEGLAPRIVAQLQNVFLELSKKTALVIVEQNLSLVSAISERVYAIKEGRVVREISDEGEIKSNVCEQYL